VELTPAPPSSEPFDRRLSRVRQAAEGVAREHRQGTHELVMTTAVPAWSFVAGRFLAVLSQTLVAALLALAGTLGAELLIHSTQAEFPAPDVRSLVALWTVLVLPAGVLLAGASFLVGTLAPRRGMVERHHQTAWRRQEDPVADRRHAPAAHHRIRALE
jgi:hypothetical protein